METIKVSHLDAEALDKIKAELEKQRDQILKDLDDLSRQDSHEADNRTSKFPEYGDKPDENAQEISDYSSTVAAEKILEHDLEDINKALDRIDENAYDGICKYCGNPINPRRLMARPTATSCVDCKTELQKNE
jgi:RNA polymerase-binding transcription factor DksA